MKYEITEEQIKDIAEGGGNTKIKEMFPEVFQPKETPEDFLNEIFNSDLICKTDKEKYPNSVFYFQGETLLLEIEKITDKTIAWVNYNKIWNPISSKLGLNYSEIHQILKVRIEDHFKLRDVTPKIVVFDVSKEIEDHFKLRDVTPLSNLNKSISQIEDHFKLRDVTPWDKVVKEQFEIEDHFKLRDVTPDKK